MSNLAINTFEEGLQCDWSTLNTPSNVLTNCLNGTLLTRNGNEYVLQNDMGNGRVETAYLPEGFIPLGTCSLGGIVYIVSYNPLTNLSLIGSFPSPERNITLDELNEAAPPVFNGKDFYDTEDVEVINYPKLKLILLNKELNPGDKFQIFDLESLSKNQDTYSIANSDIISAYGLIDNFNINKNPKYLKIKVVAILDNGTIIDLTDTLVWNDGYYIYKGLIHKDEYGKLDLDEYRNAVESNYNVFNSNVSGSIGLLFELEAINSFDVAWDAKKVNNKWNIYLFTNWTYDNNYLPSKNKINLYSVKYKAIDLEKKSVIDDNCVNPFIINNYPTSYLRPFIDRLPNKGSLLNSSFFKDTKEDTTNNILKHPYGIFYNPSYLDHLPDNTHLYVQYNRNQNRQNDGSDNLFLITSPIILKENASGIVTFTVYPGMPYGYLNYLKQTFAINIDKLGSGDIDLKEYRYYYSDNKITLNWGLDAYPAHNKKIEEVKFEFYEFNNDSLYNFCKNADKIDNWRYIEKKVLNDGEFTHGWYKPSNYKINNSNKLEKDPFPEISTNKSKSITNKTSYSGNFVEEFNLKEIGLSPDKLYLTKIIINYNSEQYITYYRFLYTNSIFNDFYFSKLDFKEIILENALDINFKLEDFDAIVKNSNTALCTPIDNHALFYILSNTNSAYKDSVFTWNSMYDRLYLFNPEYKINIDNCNNLTYKIGGLTNIDDIKLCFSSENIKNLIDLSSFEGVINFEECKIDKYSITSIYLISNSNNGSLTIKSEDVYLDGPVLVEKSRFIPNSKNKEDNSSEDYIITSNYNYNISGEFKGYTNPIFNVVVEKIDNYTILTEFDKNNASKLVIDSNNLNSDSDYLDDITSTINKDNLEIDKELNGSLNITLNTPIKVDYKNPDKVPVPYKLTPLNIKKGWLMVYGTHTHIWLYYADEYIWPGGVADSLKDHFGDDYCEYGKIKKYANVYQTLQDTLKYCDIIALRFRSNHESTPGSGSDQGNLTVYGKGKWGYSNGYNFDYDLKWISTNEDDGPNIIIYAILDSLGEVQLFSYPLSIENKITENYKLNIDWSKKTWYGLDLLPLSYDHCLTSIPGYTIFSKVPFAVLLKNLDDKILEKPFDNYYKVINNNTTENINKWNKMYYYNNYTWKVLLNFNYTINFKLQINDIDLLSSIFDSDGNLTNNILPNNLSYSGSKKDITSKVISSKEYIDNYVNTIYSNTTNTTYVIDTLGKVTPKENFNPKVLYDNTLENEIEYIKKDEGNGPIDNSQFKFKILEEKITLDASSILDNKTVSIMGRLEELNIAISNILSINDD